MAEGSTLALLAAIITAAGECDTSRAPDSLLMAVTEPGEVLTRPLTWKPHGESPLTPFTSGVSLTEGTLSFKTRRITVSSPFT